MTLHNALIAQRLWFNKRRSTWKIHALLGKQLKIEKKNPRLHRIVQASNVALIAAKWSSFPFPVWSIARTINEHGKCISNWEPSRACWWNRTANDASTKTVAENRGRTRKAARVWSTQAGSRRGPLLGKKLPFTSLECRNADDSDPRLDQHMEEAELDWSNSSAHYFIESRVEKESRWRWTLESSGGRDWLDWSRLGDRTQWGRGRNVFDRGGSVMSGREWEKRGCWLSFTQKRIKIFGLTEKGKRVESGSRGGHDPDHGGGGVVNSDPTAMAIFYF